MTDFIVARCLMCGKNYDVPEDHKEYKKLSAQERELAFICDLCNYRIRHESEDKQKVKKPM